MRRTSTLSVFSASGELLHTEEIKTGSAMGARRVTKTGAKMALDTPGSRVVVTTSRGEEARRIIESNGNYFTRKV